MSTHESTSDSNTTNSAHNLEPKSEVTVSKLGKNVKSVDQQQESQGAISKFHKHEKSTENLPHENYATKKINNELASSLEDLNLAHDNSDDNICKSDWLKARDSLENLLYQRNEKTGADVSNSKSTPFAIPTKDQCLLRDEEINSDSHIVGATKSACSSSVSKVLAWDPWDKLSRKSKKENKRRKASFVEKSHKEISPRDSSISPNQENRRDFTSGDELRTIAPPMEDSGDLSDANATTGSYENYEYQPYQARNSKSVEFTNKVMVVYIKEDKVIAESIEPLKKELEQQIRNKQMRKGHMPDMPFAKRRVSNDWFNKK